MNATEYLNSHWKKNKVWRNLSFPHHQKRFEMCASLAAGRNVIDVGCALGHSTHWLSMKSPGVAWSGLDFDEAIIAKARKLFPQFEFYYAPSIQDFADSHERAFDSVVCSEVIEHVDDDKAFIESLMRIAKDKVVITTPGRFVNDPGHLRLYTVEMLERLLSRYRFIVKKEGMFYYVEVML